VPDKGTATRETASGASSTRDSRSRPPENAIELGRRSRKAVPAAASVPMPGPRISPTDSDPWTVPQSVRDRFVQDGHRFYFPDGHPAFRDRGRRLTTESENTGVVSNLIEIAQSRGWTEITVSGTERFREEAWRQGRVAGLAVRGFRPSDEQQALLVRALARNLGRPFERGDAISEGGAPAAAPNPAVTVPSATAAWRVAGELLEHGKDAYRHDPKEDVSYFVRLKTREGVRETWGRDLERAMTKSLSRPKIGDEVVVQRTGQDTVTVRRRTRGQGLPPEPPVETQRNRWIIETRAFMDARADTAKVVRDETRGAKEVVRDHPELAGTYLSLRAAELASRALQDAEDQKAFVREVRRALALRVERGEPLPTVRLRARSTTPSITAREPRVVESPAR
jgi:hypothetical protein